MNSIKDSQMTLFLLRCRARTKSAAALGASSAGAAQTSSASPKTSPSFSANASHTHGWKGFEMTLIHFPVHVDVWFLDFAYDADILLSIFFFFLYHE